MESQFTVSTHDQGRNKLVRFDVSGLYDEFNYSIDINITRHVTVIIAPNGSGKTQCLRLMNALFSQDWLLFEKIVFSQAVYHFSNGIRLTISKSQTELDLDEENGQPPSVTVDVVDGEGIRIGSWSPLRASSPNRLIEQYLPFLARAGQNSWVDRRTGETLKLHDIFDRFSNEMPASIVKKVTQQPPDYVRDLLAEINCTLIETQRLIILAEQEDYRAAVSERDGRRTPYAISRKATKLRDIISREMNRYAALSQSLDRTFPGRAISTSTKISQEDIEKQLFLLDKKRKELMDVGILDSEQDVHMAMPNKRLDPALTSVLGVYIEDNNKKLDSLEPIYERVALFKRLIDSRFGSKKVDVSKQKGLSVRYRERDVPLETLSSGEQHQLVLFFELLFETEKNSLILIDEPEISLHISWQKKFISDLMSIIELNKFNVVLATHSPQLIGKWADLVVELGDVFEGDQTPDWRGVNR